MFGASSFADVPFGARRQPFVFMAGAATLSVSFEYQIRAATAEFITSASDTPASTPFYGSLDQPLSFSRKLSGSDGFGGFLTGQGELSLINSGGEYDLLPQQYALDGRDIEVRYGRITDPYDEWFTIFKGTASDFRVDEASVSVALQDYGYKLEVPLQANTYGGTGGIDGGSDLAGKRKPRCYGYVLNIEPPLVIPNSLVYQVNDGQINAISAVYVRGVALGFAADYATSALLIAATIPSGQYATCLAEGLLRINFLLDGQVTCDVEGDKTGAVFVSTKADIIRRIVGTATSLVDPDDLYLPSFTALNVAQAASIGYWVDHNDSSTVAQALSNIIGFAGWIGFRRAGTFEVVQFTAPAGPPALYLDRSHIRDIKREVLPSNLTPAPWRWRVGWSKNWTVQTDLAGAVSDSRRAFLAEQYRFAVSENSAIKIDHPFSREHDEIEAHYLNESDAQAEADRLLALFRGSRALYRITLDTQPFSLNVGEVVNVTFPRFDLTLGRNLRAVEINENAQTDSIEIVGYG